MENLDAMDADALRKFAGPHSAMRSVKRAREVFPERPRGYVRAWQLIHCYCWKKSTALDARRNGWVQSALGHEDIAESIYKALPDFARW